MSAVAGCIDRIVAVLIAVARDFHHDDALPHRRRNGVVVGLVPFQRHPTVAGRARYLQFEQDDVAGAEGVGHRHDGIARVEIVVAVHRSREIKLAPDAMPRTPVPSSSPANWPNTAVPWSAPKPAS